MPDNIPLRVVLVQVHCQHLPDHLSSDTGEIRFDVTAGTQQTNNPTFDIKEGQTATLNMCPFRELDHYAGYHIPFLICTDQNIIADVVCSGSPLLIGYKTKLTKPAS